MKFTPNIRKAIYAAAAAIVPLFTALGFVTDGQAQSILASIAAALAFFASVTAIRNVPASDAPDVPLSEVTDVSAPEL